MGIRINISVDINTNVVKNYQTAEYGKFVELKGTEFPPVSVVRLSYPDTSSAFPANSGLKPLSSVDIYPKYAILTHISNPEDISISLSAANININLQDLEDIARTINQNVSSTNTRLSGIDTTLSTINRNVSSTNTELKTVVQQTSAVQNLLTTVVSNLTSINDNSITKTTTSQLTAKLYISGSKRIYSIFGVSTSINNQYIQLYDTNSSTPSGIPVGIFFVPANSNFSFDLNRGLNFTSNVLVINSITPVVYTQGNDDLFMTVIHS